MKRFDTICWYIVTLHQMVGHDKAATVLGQDPGDARRCVLCRYERGAATQQEVIDRLGG